MFRSLKGEENGYPFPFIGCFKIKWGGRGIDIPPLCLLVVRGGGVRESRGKGMRWFNELFFFLVLVWLFIYLPD
jgi:hypothetical protein